MVFERRMVGDFWRCVVFTVRWISERTACIPRSCLRFRLKSSKGCTFIDWPSYGAITMVVVSGEGDSMEVSSNETEYLAKRRDQIIVGVVYSTVGGACLLPYLLILVVLHTNSDRLSGSAFRIMFHVGITDCLQLIFHFVGGVFCLANSTFAYWINKFCGGVLNAAWVALIPFTMLLAFNRFTAIFFFGNARYDRPIYTTILIACCWLWPALFFASYMTDYCSVLFDVEMFSWGYDTSLWSPVINNAEYYSITAQLVITGLLYILVVCKIAITRQKYSANANRQSKEMRKEIRVLIQAIIISGYAGFCLFAWHSYQLFFDDSKWTFFVINLLWILNGGVNPVLYLTMNRTIRKLTVVLLTFLLTGARVRLKLSTVGGALKTVVGTENRGSLATITKVDAPRRAFQSTTFF